MMLPRSARPRIGFVLLALVLISPAVVNAQVPKPYVPDVNQRSGLITRYSPPLHPFLPPDEDRDSFYDTRYADDPYSKYANSMCDGGLYGKRWPADCTASFYPYFRGSPGLSTIGPGCQPYHSYIGRAFGNFVHPFRPVCYYYDRGSYVPVYDLDPLIVGPGPFPWPYLKRQHNGG